MAAAVLAVGRLVEGEQERPPREPGHEREPALLAAGEPVRASIGKGGKGKPQPLAQLVGVGKLVRLQAQLHLLAHRIRQEAKLRVLHDVARESRQLRAGHSPWVPSTEPHRAGNRSEQAHREPQERGLAASIGAHERDALALTNGHVDRAQNGLPRFEPESDVRHLDDRQPCRRRRNGSARRRDTRARRRPSRRTGPSTGRSRSRT